MKLTIPQTINDVTTGQYLQFLALRRLVHNNTKDWTPRREARHILSIFGNVDADDLGEVDDQEFQAAFARLGFLQEFNNIGSRTPEYTGGTFTVAGETFTLPDDLNSVTAGQYEIMERYLQGSTTFEMLHYVVAVLTMWQPNILKHEAELHRRAQLFAEELPFVFCWDLAFFLPSGRKKGSGILTQHFMHEVKMKTSNYPQKASSL